MVRHNNVIPNGPWKKKWQFRVKTWFDQPARKLACKLLSVGHLMGFPGTGADGRADRAAAAQLICGRRRECAAHRRAECRLRITAGRPRFFPQPGQLPIWEKARPSGAGRNGIRHGRTLPAACTHAGVGSAHRPQPHRDHQRSQLCRARLLG
jgi:hypothetical protein